MMTVPSEPRATSCLSAIMLSGTHLDGGKVLSESPDKLGFNCDMSFPSILGNIFERIG